MSGIRLSLCSVCCLIFAAAPAVLAADDVPPRSESGQTLVVPAAHLDAGDVYHVTPGEDTQVLCVSDAPLQRSAVTCNRVVGYFVSPFELGPGEAPLIAGALRIPVASLTTGVRAYDGLLRSKPMFDMESYPEITARLVRVGSVEQTAESKERTAYKLQAVVELRVKDKACMVEAPVEMELTPFTWRTMGRNVGELLVLRTKFELKLAELGLEKPGRELAERIADTLKLDLFLLANTMAPDRDNDPKWKAGEFARRCRFLTLVRDFKDDEKGYAFGRAVLSEYRDRPVLLLALAQAVLSEDDLERRDFSFALEAARRAAELTQPPDPAILATVAQIHAERGDFAAAGAAMRDVIEAAGADAPAEQIAEWRATAEKYEARAAGAGGSAASSQPRRR